MRTKVLTCLGIAATVSVSAFLLSPAAKASTLNRSCKAGTYGEVMSCCASWVTRHNQIGFDQSVGSACRQVVVCVDADGNACHVKKKTPPPVILKEIVDEIPPNGPPSHGSPPGGGGGGDGGGGGNNNQGGGGNPPGRVIP